MSSQLRIHYTDIECYYLLRPLVLWAFIRDPALHETGDGDERNAGSHDIGNGESGSSTLNNRSGRDTGGLFCWLESSFLCERGD